MWGAASFLFCCARCSGTPVWARGSRSSRRSPHHVAVPSGGGRPPGPGGAEGRACGSPAGVGAEGGGAPPRPLSILCERGGGEWGGPFGPLATPPDGRGGGAAWQSWHALPPPPST